MSFTLEGRLSFKSFGIGETFACMCDSMEQLARLDGVQAIFPLSLKPLVTDVVANVRTGNKNRTSRLIGESSKFKPTKKYANGLQGSWTSNPSEFWGAYFSAEAFSYRQTSQDTVRAARSSILCAHAAQNYLNELLAELEALPESMPVGKESADLLLVDVYRFSALRQLAVVLRSVQSEFQGFADTAVSLIGASDSGRRPTTTGSSIIVDDAPLIRGLGSYVRSSSWTHDFRPMISVLQRGYFPAHRGGLNTRVLTSSIVAAGALRSWLESILFLTTFGAVLRSTPPINAEGWSDALKAHRDSGKLNDSEVMWVTKAYGALSEALHMGATLSAGEIFMLHTFVSHVERNLGAA